MIALIDSLTLVYAKLHAKRILLFSTITVSGLLFVVLYGSTIVFEGITKSADRYTQKALDGKYLVKSTPILPQDILGPNRIDVSDNTITELNTLQSEYIARQKLRASELKIAFNEKTVPSILVPNPYVSNDSMGRHRLMINNESPVYQLYLQKLQQNYVKTAKNKLSDLQSIARSYGATVFNQNTPAVVSYETLRYLKDGKEDISNLNESSPSNSDFSTYGYLTSSVRNSAYSFVDESLIKRFILPDSQVRRKNITAIPVVITAKEATELFGKQLNIGSRPDKASEQVAWMKSLQEKSNGLTYSACYRNQADVAQITEATRILSDIEQHKSDKAYVKPALVYNLPTKPCGGLSVMRDMRSTSEKNEANKQIEVSKKLGIYQEPVHQLLTFKIVGIMPTSPEQGSTTSLSSFMADLLGAHYGVGAIIPRQLYEQLPVEAKYKNLLQDNDNSIFNLRTLQDAGIGETIVTFRSLGQARAFIKEQGCSPTQNACGKPFTLEAYGSNYLLMDDLQATLTKLLSYALLGGAAVATVVVWFMMTRVIIDSRRETAVFRAIGARRRDIANIYLLYSSIVALCIIIFALIGGVGSAFIVQLLYGTDATNYAQASYGVFSGAEQFNLHSFTSPLLLELTVGIFLISVIAAVPPLVRNVRRSPIRDMRDE